jgi:hypothetical protein
LSYDWAWGALDATPVPMPTDSIDWPWGREPSRVPLTGDYSPDWHTKGLNEVFADGHAKIVARSVQGAAS